MTAPELTFGLDVGSNSLGWSVVEQTETGGRIVAAGVRIFPEGVDRDQKGGEKSKNEQRRLARGMRRQVARRARRKRRLREALVAAGLLPDVALLKPDDSRRIAWESHAYHQADPYSLRAFALKDKLEPFELGRVFLHLAQRRGFLSNRKKDLSAKEASDLVKEMEVLQASVGDKKLGQYLLEQRGPNGSNRIRGLHTTRKMYENEFDAIWNKQREFHPSLLTDQLRHGSVGKQEYPAEPRPLGGENLLVRFGIEGMLFFQRRMYWPKAAVGRCELEPKLPRCPKADRSAQRFRLLQEVNNLRLLDTDTLKERPLEPKELERLLAWLAEHKDIKFDDIPKRLGLLDGVRFNLERGSRKSLKGMETDCLLANKNLFGKEWFARPDAEKNAIVRALLDEQLDDETVIAIATRDWGLSPDASRRVAEANLPEGYARYCLTAIDKLLPHLERGLRLNSATGEVCALSEAGYLNPHEGTAGKHTQLPGPPEITNPLVRQALFEIRKVVNALLRTYGKPAHIHIEMAREIKGGAQERSELSQRMQERKALKDQAADEIRGAGLKPTFDSITRFLLWKEQGEICVYSGKPISLRQLMEGEADADHILPRQRSLDNSQMNRVICFRAENANKGDRTPHEWLAATQPEKYAQVLQRAVKLPYAKAKRFRQESVELTDFFARQFVDTAYIATQVREYIQCLGVDVVCTKGQHTAELRRHWGLNTVLRDDGLDLKNRDDHRHHAIDALVIALTDRKRLQELARLYKSLNRGAAGETLDDPWDGFRAQAESTINAVNVSFRGKRKVQGQLHDEMLYGPTQKRPNPISNDLRPWTHGWMEEEGVYVRRRKIEELNNTKQVAKIRDAAIREIVRQRLIDRQIDPDKPQKINPKVWEPCLRMLSGVQILKVRMVERGDSYQKLNRKGFVELGSNHHYEIVELLDNRGEPLKDKKGLVRRDGFIVTMWEASQRIIAAKRAYEKVLKELRTLSMSNQERDSRQRAAASRFAKEFPLIRTDHGPKRRFVMSLSINELVLVDMPGVPRILHRVQKMSEGSIILRPHYYAGKVSDTDKPPIILRAGPSTLRGQKVFVDILGRKFPTK